MASYIGPAPLYTFLRFANSKREEEGSPLGNRILDCGAGGPYPPLVLFHNHGYETYGIDISDERVQLACDYALENGINLDIKTGDMRSIPFEDGYFDFVYEIYSMCHMTKEDIDTSIRQIERVLKRGGYCLVCFMSSDTWPMAGREGDAGEFWLGETHMNGGGELHTVYRDGEPEKYLSAFEIVRIEKNAIRDIDKLRNRTPDEWREFYPDPRFLDKYGERLERGNHTHVFYTLRKPKVGQIIT